MPDLTTAACSRRRAKNPVRLAPADAPPNRVDLTDGVQLAAAAGGTDVWETLI